MKRIAFFTLLICLGAATTFAQPTDTLNLLPRPLSVTINAGRFTFNADFAIGIKGPESAKFIAAINRFFQQLGRRVNINFPQEFISAGDNNANARLFITYGQTIEPAIGMDESYSLKVNADKITLTAATDIGAERGLETLYQLVSPDKNGFYCPLVEVNDSPRFKWRGLMIDVARHFIPFEVLKRNVDAMAIVKLNVLHLHLSDDEGFRVESKVFPLLQQKGSNGFYYSQDQVKELVSYAHDRGIIVVPEFDLPGHCSSILAAYPYLASYSSDYKPSRRYKMDSIKNLNLGKVMQLIAQMPTPTIDPTKETTYAFFDKFIKEMGALFPDAYFHVGADENNGVAWKQNPGIAAFMQTKGMKSTDELQAYFVKRMYDIAKKYNKQLIGWEEAFNQAIPQDVILQKWKPSGLGPTLNAAEVVKHGNQLVISAGYYLDLFMPAYIHYQTDPVPADMGQADADKGILGAEAAQWAELMDGGNEELRVWPRAAAIAERLWSPANVKDVDDMYRRLWVLDFELNDRALDANENYLKILARWVNDEDLSPVLTLANVYTPVKGYKRLMGGMLGAGKTPTNLNSPMVNIADVVHSDSETGWYFRQSVAAYLKDHKDADRQAIKSLLTRWQSNKARFDVVADITPYLQQTKVLSDNLSTAATIGLQAINGEGNKDDQLKQLQQLEQPSHEVVLAILPEIEALVTGMLKPLPSTYPMF
jgi:hexosaminidase